MKYQDIINYLRKIKNIKTKDIDNYNKKLIKNNQVVSDLKNYLKQDNLIFRTYFQVSLAHLNSSNEQLLFIEDHLEYLNDWWHVDILPQFLHKPLDFSFVYTLSKKYLKSSHIFTRRWGYVMFITGLQKDKKNTKKILSLLKDDEEYYVQMAEAWLICELATYNELEVIEYLKTSKLKYNILGKAIQKICDSYRISDSIKETAKSLRKKLKNN